MTTVCPLALGLGAKALLDLEARMAMERAAREAIIELMALTSSRQALCDVMLSAGRGSAQLVSCLDEAHR